MQIRNSPEQWLWFRGQHSAIISRTEWEQANPDRAKNKTKITPWNDLRGILKCGICGSNMVVLQSHKVLSTGEKKYFRYLKCSRYRRMDLDGCVNHDPITYEEVRIFLIETLLEKGRLIELNLTNKPFSDRDEKIKEAQKNVKSVQTKKQQLVDLYLDQLITKIEFEEKRTELDRQAQYFEDQFAMYSFEKSSHD